MLLQEKKLKYFSFIYAQIKSLYVICTSSTFRLRATLKAISIIIYLLKDINDYSKRDKQEK